MIRSLALRRARALPTRQKPPLAAWCQSACASAETSSSSRSFSTYAQYEKKDPSLLSPVSTQQEQNIPTLAVSAETAPPPDDSRYLAHHASASAFVSIGSVDENAHNSTQEDTETEPTSDQDLVQPKKEAEIVIGTEETPLHNIQLTFHSEDEIRRKTSRILNETDVPVGALSPEMWVEAKELIFHWVGFRYFSHTPESVDQSFALMDRLVLEQEMQDFPPLSLDFLSTRMIRSVVKNWNRCVRNFHSYSLEDQALLRFEFTPMEVLARLENYSDRSPQLQFDTKCLNMIIDGAGRCSFPGPSNLPGMISPRVATSFSQSLFDRMAANSNHAQIQNNNDLGVPFGEEIPPSPPPLGQYNNPNRSSGSLPSTRPDLVTYSSLIHLFSQNGLAARAEALLDHLYKQYTVSRNRKIQPDVRVFTSVLIAWARSNEPNAADRAQMILERMQTLAECGIQSVAPDEVAYIAVLNCWAQRLDRGKKRKNKLNQATKNKCVEKASELFAQMQSLGLASTEAYNVMINVLGKAGKPKEAEKLYEQMRERPTDDSSDSKKVQPGIVALNTMLTAWANSGDRKCGDRAEQLLNEFEQWYRSGTVSDPPDKVTYNNVLLCLAMSRQPERAEALLERMKQTKSAHGVDISPDKISYNIVINGYGKAMNPRKAEALLESMYQDFIAMNGNNTCLKPDMRTFCTVLDAWLKSDEPRAADRADAILKTMQNLHDANILDVAPGTIAFNIALACWCKSNHPQAAKRALEILDTMEGLYNRGSPNVRPDKWAYLSVITVYANRGDAQKAEEILERMHMQALPRSMGGGGNIHEKPTSSSYDKVLAAYSRSRYGAAAERAEALWRRWRIRFETDVIDIPPNELSVQLVLNSWENVVADHDEAGRKAMAFLRDLEKNYSFESQENSEIDPYNTVVRICAKGKDADSAHDSFMGMCDKCLQKVPRTKPTLETLNWVLAVWRASGRVDAAQKVEILLQKVHELHDSNAIDWKPTSVSYRFFLHCLVAQPSMKAGIKANAVLQHLEQASRNDSDAQMKPEGKDYAQVIRLWCNVDDVDAALLADNAYCKMKARYEAGDETCKPTASVYHDLIRKLKNCKLFPNNARVKELEKDMSTILPIQR